jgi:hypothetical protein
MLVDHANAKLRSIAGGTDFHRVAVDPDLPCIWAVKASQHIHEGALARTILTKQSVDLARSYREIRLIVG